LRLGGNKDSDKPVKCFPLFSLFGAFVFPAFVYLLLLFLVFFPWLSMAIWKSKWLLRLYNENELGKRFS